VIGKAQIPLVRFAVDLSYTLAVRQILNVLNQPQSEYNQSIDQSIDQFLKWLKWHSHCKDQ